MEYGHGATQEKKDFLIGCTLKKLVLWGMVIKNHNLHQREWLILMKIRLNQKAYLLDSIIVMFCHKMDKFTHGVVDYTEF